MFGWKLEPPSRVSTMGGSIVTEPVYGMPYGPGVSCEPLFPVDQTPRHVGTLGVMREVALSDEVGLAEFERARALARDTHAPSEPAPREPTIDERLRRLGIRPRSGR